MILGPITEQTIADIRAIIDQGELRIGGRLPSERELAELLGVSRSTVRQALDELRETGEIESVRGRGGGTFVSSTNPAWEHYSHYPVLSTSHRLVDHSTGVQGVPESIKQQGLRATTKVIFAGTDTCPTEVAHFFGYKEPKTMAVIERVRIADEIPLSFERGYLSLDYFPDILNHDFTQSLYGILQNEYGMTFARVNERIEVTAAKGRCAEYLKVDTGQPLLSVVSWATDVQGRTVEFSKDLYRADRVRLISSNDYRERFDDEKNFSMRNLTLI